MESTAKSHFNPCKEESSSTSAKKRKILDRKDSHDSSGIEENEGLNVERRRVNMRLRSFRFYSVEEEIEERRLGISTKLKLFEDPWRIKKVLQESDVNNLCRLMLSKRLVENHILPLWEVEGAAMVEIEEGGRRVTIWDMDTDSTHELVFKRWRLNRSYVFTDNWMVKFVRRRGLRRGDEIGLFWDIARLRFCFRVLARAMY
ncbi:putative B3 domain-containing protein At1g78640 [Diospyros lotus]|uniref:putative B3 domain-containing protein At1g78640 n=1 Tax=Diospyros lotus TaxID=55363 RepID=UPI00224EB6DA|nr:putative B3 domain-containing protein At1g78640 [Diospyros lotus]